MLHPKPLSDEPTGVRYGDLSKQDFLNAGMHINTDQFLLAPYGCS